MVKQIAQVVFSAQNAYEASWDPETKKYARDIRECFETACIAVGLPVALGEVLDLANHWCNDLADWAKEHQNDD